MRAQKHIHTHTKASRAGHKRRGSAGLPRHVLAEAAREGLNRLT